MSKVVQTMYNEVYQKAIEALEEVSAGSGYTGILEDIGMKGAPIEDNLEIAFEQYLDFSELKKINPDLDLEEEMENSISMLHMKYCL